MSSAGSSSGGKAVSVIVVLAVLVVAFLAYNKICDECLFAFPEKGGGESGQSVIIAPGGAVQPPGFNWGTLVLPFIILALISSGVFYFGMKWADKRASRPPPQGYGGQQPVPPGQPPAGGPTQTPPGGPTPPRRADLGKEGKSIFAKYSKDQDKKETPIPPTTAPRTIIDKEGAALKKKFPKVFGEWAKIVGGGALIGGFVYFNNKLSIKNHSGWKFHVYADTPEDVFSIGDAIIPVLKKLPVVSKVVPTPEGIAKMAGEQKGKAFTIYVYSETPKDFGAIKKIASEITKKLDPILNKTGLRAKKKYFVLGDKLVPNTKSGRIFYTYELDRKRSEFEDPLTEESYRLSYYRRSRERKKDNIYNISSNPDIFDQNGTKSIRKIS